MADSPRKRVRLSAASDPGQIGSLPAQTAPARSSLLWLPAEIRCQIWRFLVVLPHAIRTRKRDKVIPKNTRYLKTLNKRKKCYQQRKITILAPAFTCRAIYQEVTAMYYSENSFDLYISFPYLGGTGLPKPTGNTKSSNDLIKTFADAIGRSNFALIKRVQVDCTRVLVVSTHPFWAPLHEDEPLSILQDIVKDITAQFRPDVQLMPQHEDETFTDIISEKFRVALSKMQRLPSIGSQVAPIHVD